MSDQSRFRHPVLILLLLVCLPLAPACSRNEPQPFRFEVLLEETLELEIGSPVRTETEVLGRVTALNRTEDGFVASLELEPDYRGRLSSNAGFQVVKTSSGFELLLTEAFGTPAIEDGARIDARPGWLEKLTRGIEDWEGRTRQLLGGLGASFRDFVQELGQSEEARALKDSVEELGQDLATVTRDRYQSFLEKELPALEERARRHRDKLLDEGRTQEAEIFWKWFQRWANTMRGRPEQAEEDAPEESARETRPPGP